MSAPLKQTFKIFQLRSEIINIRDRHTLDAVIIRKQEPFTSLQSAKDWLENSTEDQAPRHNKYVILEVFEKD